ncbi:MAG: CBS domain-containing protein [Caldilineae bacterium]|nr:MAG: CBS domain-containing protein [Caldilineae bacterium]
MFVKDAMTPDPITVSPQTTLPEIAQIMREKKIRRVPVVEDGRLVGIVSDHDVMASMPSPATTLSRWEMNALLDRVTAREIMTSPVYVTSPDCPLEEAARVLIERKFGAMPVLDGDKLVGIITETDFFRVFVEMLSGGEVPGLRFVLSVEEGRGVLAQIGAIVNENGGNIIAVATLNEPGGKRKRVMVKEQGADAGKLKAALEAVDIDVVDVRERRMCAIRAVP